MELARTPLAASERSEWQRAIATTAPRRVQRFSRGRRVFAQWVAVQGYATTKHPLAASVVWVGGERLGVAARSMASFAPLLAGVLLVAALVELLPPILQPALFASDALTPPAVPPPIAIRPTIQPTAPNA